MQDGMQYAVQNGQSTCLPRKSGGEETEPCPKRQNLSIEVKNMPLAFSKAVCCVFRIPEAIIIHINPFIFNLIGDLKPKSVAQGVYHV